MDFSHAPDPDPNHRKPEINPKTESSRPTHPKMEGYPKTVSITSRLPLSVLSPVLDRHPLGKRRDPAACWRQRAFPAISLAKRFDAVACPQPKSLPINAEGLKPPISAVPHLLLSFAYLITSQKLYQSLTEPRRFPSYRPQNLRRKTLPASEILLCGDICSMAAEIAQDAAESAEDQPASYHDVIRSLEAKAGVRQRTPLFLPSPSDTDSVSSETPTVVGVEPESTRKRTRREESSTSPEPPRKKIRHAQSSRAVRRFLDVAAVEVNGDDEEDDPDEDDDDFIDVDEPRHDFGPQQNFTPLLPDELLNFGPEGDELKKVAQRIVERSRARRRQAIPKPTTTFSQNLLANCNVDLDLDPGPEAPPMLAIRTPRDGELALVQCLSDSGLVLSVGTMGVGSRLVFVELETGLIDVEEDAAAAVALQIWARNCGIAWDYRNSVLIPPADRHCLLRPPGHPEYYDPFGATNSWARLQTGRYKGDIALIEAHFTSNSPETLLVVPRIPYDDDDLKKPPPRLFDPNRFLNANTTASLERRNQTWLWKETKRVFGATSFPGLEQILNPRPALERQPYDLAVVPTENELDYFRASGGRELDLPFMGLTSALQEGDRVYFPRSPAELPWGGRCTAVILRIKSEVTDGVRLRMAVLVPDYDGQSLQTPDVLANLLQYAMYEPMSLLKLHLLAFRRQIRVGDRVRLVLGEHRGGCGRVSRSHSDSLWVQLVNPPRELQVPLHHIRVVFQCGDVVRVIRGTHTGKIGFMASLEIGGYCTLYPAEIHDGKFEFVPVNVAARNEFSLVVQHDDEAQETPTYRIPTSHLVFENFDHQSDLQLQTQDSNVGERPWMALERKHRQLMLDMKDKLDWVRHKEILIVGKQHHMKGLAGQVIDYQWTAPPKVVDAVLNRELRMTRHLQLVVGLTMSNATTNVMYTNVRHKSTGLTLERAHVLTSMKDGCFFERLARSKYGDPPQLDELDEMRWLINLKFIGKRVDLRVGSKEDFAKVMRSYGNLARKISNKHVAYADQVGFLVPLDQRPLETDRINKLFPFISPTSVAQRVNLPLPVLRPVRTIDGVSIAEFPERVIVIGPDVYDKTDRIGHYAEVVPRMTDHPMLVVRVRFKLERTDSGSLHRQESLYWLQALCRSTNERIDDPPGPDMDFNAIPP
ncbi:hypothetical protein C8F01DRAFT_1261629 [Mycena amicta]|nr:hypothetical protein C8F01DRAFT_1261629 [Mycena amicta]